MVAIGGFSGRESQVSTGWLAEAVEDGRIGWVLTTGGQGGMPNDPRVGASDVMTVVASTCAPVSIVDGLYDCRARAGALREASARAGRVTG